MGFGGVGAYSMGLGAVTGGAAELSGLRIRSYDEVGDEVGEGGW